MMKKKNEWLKQETVFPALDDLLSKPGWVFGNFTPNAAAVELGLSPNTTFYKLFYAWDEAHRAKVSSTGPASISEAEAELRQNAQKFIDEMATSLVSILSNSITVINQAADQRVAIAERSSTTVAGDRAEIFKAWEKAEKEREAADWEVAELQKQLAEKDAEIAALQARLEERDAIFETIKTKMAAPTTPADAQEPTAAVADGIEPADDRAEDQPVVSRQCGETALADGESFDFNFDDRPSASEPDRPQGGQSELPLASNDPNPQEDR
jgi:hypothetical protein